jgi:gluconolactonase
LETRCLCQSLSGCFDHNGFIAQINREESMRKTNLACLLASVALAAAAMMPTLAAAQAPAPAAPPPPQMPPSLVPSLSVNLMTPEGSAAFAAQWKAIDAKVIEVPALSGHMPGYDKTYDISPHAGEAGFDDSSWPNIDAKGLGDRRGGGKFSFMWYRTTLTVPAKIGDFDTTGAKAVLTAYVDDYAEVWVNGQMPRRSGYPSPATIQGLNMPNRVVLADSVKPGDKFQIAVFGVNGPLSVAPSNFIFFRQASIELYK